MPEQWDPIAETSKVRSEGRSTRQDIPSDLHLLFLNLEYPDQPFLVMGVNPSSMTRNMSKIVNVEHTISAIIEEHWAHDQLDTISFTASTLGMFQPPPDMNNFVEALDVYFNLSMAGYNRQYWYIDAQNRHRSAAGEAFHNFLQMYLNSGAEYYPTGVISDFRGIAMIMDNNVYFGYFSDYSFTEEAERPNRFEYNFTFKVRFSSEQVMPDE